MKTLKLFLPLIVTCCLSPGVLATPIQLDSDGPGSSGGGPSIVCPATKKTHRTAQMLDLYEGRNHLGLNIQASKDPVDVQLNRVIQRLRQYNPFLAATFIHALNYVMRNEQPLKQNEVMPSGTDIGDRQAIAIPDGCEIKYVGYYEASDTLKVSSIIKNLLSPTDQAAFYTHEALYKITRKMAGAQKSAHTRIITAYLMSDGDLHDLDLLVAKDFMWQNERRRDDNSVYKFVISTLPLSGNLDEIQVLYGKYPEDKSTMSIGPLTIYFKCLRVAGEDTESISEFSQDGIRSYSAKDCDALDFAISYAKWVQVIYNGHTIYSMNEHDSVNYKAFIIPVYRLQTSTN